MYALRGMELMTPRPPEAVFAKNRDFERQADEKLKQYPTAEVEAAMKKAIDAQVRTETERTALMQAWAKQNPGKTRFDVGGKETQDLYDKVLSKPVTKITREDNLTCSYCNKSSTVPLQRCSRCKVVTYCGRDCQLAAWKAHRKECIPWERNKEPKVSSLTWDQVEAHQGAPVEGRFLEVRAILDESVTMQVFQFQDREGKIRRVAAYTENGKIPGLKQGSLLRWKNPRFHRFMDGSSGARIEQDDLKDVSVSL